MPTQQIRRTVRRRAAGGAWLCATIVVALPACASRAGARAPEPLVPESEGAFNRGLPGVVNAAARLGGRPVRIAVGEGVSAGDACAAGSWRAVDDAGRVLASGMGCSALRLAADGARVRLATADGAVVSAARLVLRPDHPDSVVLWRGKRYRGELDVTSASRGLVVVNRVGLEDYLRGVLPLEIGGRDPRDRAAVEAQAVAARTYAAARMGANAMRAWDLVSSTADQVYGGRDAEHDATDAAVRATRGLVLTFNDAIAQAPYHSHGGAVTAAPDEVFWRANGAPYLRPVDDRAPDGRCWCDASGRAPWERRFTGRELAELLDRHGAAYGARPPAGAGVIRDVRIAARGPSGRITRLELETSGGRVVLRGNDIRYVLRTRGELLPSTAFDVRVEGGVGEVAALVLRGTGAGHGVGMSQWGAIGRARAGQDARTILAAYYPGTRLAPLE
ncbi:MAG: SpoIID/LytB domain-containing protein [Gemmatimonadaceae bacterium]|jgi:stage II sporulation protein D|nr:SpoIID/LytB domain-containing protein [Gemmatimonadaceae bacterium]